jgi:YesN/AraC family two-component response regulator
LRDDGADAGSSQEALEALSHTNVDVMLADIGMPVEDGMRD